MKNIIVLSLVLILQGGLNSFAQTNAAPPSGHVAPRPKGQGQKAVSKPETPGDSAVPSRDTLTRRAEAQREEQAEIRRIAREELLSRQKSTIDYDEAINQIFRSDNDQMGETSIRDTVVTIFPTRH